MENLTIILVHVTQYLSILITGICGFYPIFVKRTEDQEINLFFIAIAFLGLLSAMMFIEPRINPAYPDQFLRIMITVMTMFVLFLFTLLCKAFMKRKK